MSNLVYLMCSLPSLSYGQSPPITVDELHNEAKSQLSKKHFRLLQSLDIRKLGSSAIDGGPASIRQMFEELELDLNEIRDARAQKRTPDPGFLPKNVGSVNPLEREKAIMHWQWEELDSIEAGKTFSVTELLVYKMRLQLLHRLHSFNIEEGGKVLESVVNPKEKQEEE